MFDCDNLDAASGAVYLVTTQVRTDGSQMRSVSIIPNNIEMLVTHVGKINIVAGEAHEDALLVWPPGVGLHREAAYGDGDKHLFHDSRYSLLFTKPRGARGVGQA